MPHRNKQIFYICIHKGDNHCLWSEIVYSFFLLGIKTVFISLLYKHNFWGDGSGIDDHKRRPLLLLSKPLSVFEVVVSNWWWKARTFNSFFKSSSLNQFAFVKEKKRETKKDLRIVISFLHHSVAWNLDMRRSFVYRTLCLSLVVKSEEEKQSDMSTTTCTTQKHEWKGGVSQ